MKCRLVDSTSSNKMGHQCSWEDSSSLLFRGFRSGRIADPDALASTPIPGVNVVLIISFAQKGIIGRRT
jgi:hypothetical protein